MKIVSATSVPLICQSQSEISDVYLRSFDESDAEAFMNWASDEEVTKFLTWHSYSSIEQAQFFLRDVVKKHPYFKAICVGKDLVGSITLDEMLFEGKEVAELGYVMAKAFWGNGYATLAVKKALRKLHGILDVKTVVAFVDPTNIASKRVLEKAGFLYRAHFPHYRLIKGEWKDRDMYEYIIQIT